MNGATLTDLGTGGAVLLAGGIALTRRDARAVGTLLVATGAAWLAGSAVDALVFLHRGPLFHLLLAYPRVRVDGLQRAAIVAAGYVTAAVEPLGASDPVTVAVCALVAGAAGERWLRAGGIDRRAAGSAAAAAVLVCGALAWGAIVRASGADPTAVLGVYEAAIVVATAGLAADVLLGGWSRGVVAGLMLDVGQLERAAPLADEIGRAVGDRSLTIAYRSDGGYVDEAGRPVELPAAGDRRRAATVISEGTALVHDRAALADPDVARAATAAARLALGNAHLHGEVAARVQELEASARRLVSAGDDERRRVAVAVEEGAELHLASAAQRLAAIDPELRSAAAEAAAEVHAFAAGLRPQRLASDGLAGALDDLAQRAHVPVEVHAPLRRFDDVVESTLFFVCSEALANVAKHARASRARVNVAAGDGRVVAEISDDGAGGADPAHGSGLRGLADRVEALGGALLVDSPPGAGTTVRAEVVA
jgi:signal transduction histidine kinase